MEKWFKDKLKALNQSQTLIEDAKEKVNIILEEIKDVIRPIIEVMKQKITEDKRTSKIIIEARIEQLEDEKERINAADTPGLAIIIGRIEELRDVLRLLQNPVMPFEWSTDEF